MLTIEERLTELENQVAELKRELHSAPETIEGIEADMDGEPEIDWEEQREEEETQLAGDCKCGAWQFGKNGVVHVADCCCGAE